MSLNYLWRGHKKIVFCLFSALEMQMFSALEDLRSKTSHKPGNDLHKRGGFLCFCGLECHVKPNVQSTTINGPEKHIMHAYH